MRLRKAKSLIFSLRQFQVCHQCLNLALVSGLAFFFLNGPDNSLSVCGASACIESYNYSGQEEKSDNEEMSHGFEFSTFDDVALREIRMYGTDAKQQTTVLEGITSHYLDVKSPPPESGIPLPGC